VISVGGVPASIVDVVDVVAVRHGHMAAALTVQMRVVGVTRVTGHLAFVGMSLVRPMKVSVVGVVNVVAVRHGHVTASRAVRMIMLGVLVVLCHRSHRLPPRSGLPRGRRCANP
jgi:hypothetical protein